MTDDSKSYRDGLVDGRILALEEITAQLKDAHEKFQVHTNGRISNLEKMVWIASGTVLAVTLLPEIRALLA